ncbi:winged helix-turn-helix domain-containing protein [Saccharothrix longispora]|uniref:winged helix-turn-helix domain-containing protein n=1 Tax=Saccharothrix longispora TaxID=33920 RepID=UPI0028FDC04C|nr:winged helix-turn-helix domain-containing protein [Saccharothrix longispora]MDU0289189.1 winged helix-turn-helix domain-containing protein [Saccharothrix longispora]
MRAFPDVADVEVTVVIRLTATAPATDAADAAGRLAEAIRSAFDAPFDAPFDAAVVVDLPAVRAEPRLRVLADSRRVLVRGAPVELTRLEFDLLHHLCAHPRQVHRRTALMARVWGATSFVDTRTVDVHVRRIRRKLGDAASVITTVRGVGYRVDDAGDVVVERDALAG